MKRVLIYFTVLTVVFGGFNLWRYINHPPKKGDTIATSETDVDENEADEPDAQKNIPIAQTTIEETVITDEAGVVIKATHIEYEEHSASLFLSVKNNSDKKISISSDDYSSINDVMFDANVWWIVEPSDEDDACVYISYDWLTMHGINEIAVFEIGFEFYFYGDNEDLYTTPTRIKTSVADGYKRDEEIFRKAIINPTVQEECAYSVDSFSESAVFEEQDISIVSQTLINGYKRKVLLLEINNNSAQGIRVKINDVHLNDLLVVDGCWTSLYVFPNQKGIISLNTDGMLEYDHWSLFGIDSLSHVDMKVEVVDLYGETIVENKAVRVPFKDSLQTFEKTRDVVYNKNNVRIFKVGITEDTSIYPDVLVYLLVENNRANDIVIFDALTESFVNEKACDRYSSEWMTIPPGETALYTITFDSDDLEDIGIRRVQQINEIKVETEIRYESYGDKDKPMLTITQ